MKSFLSILTWTVKKVLLFFIVTIRPLLGPANCRFEETCGKFAIRQLKTKPLHRALWNTIKRLVSCANPFWKKTLALIFCLCIFAPQHMLGMLKKNPFFLPKDSRQMLQNMYNRHIPQNVPKKRVKTQFLLQPAPKNRNEMKNKKRNVFVGSKIYSVKQTRDMENETWKRFAVSDFGYRTVVPTTKADFEKIRKNSNVILVAMPRSIFEQLEPALELPNPKKTKALLEKKEKKLKKIDQELKQRELGLTALEEYQTASSETDEDFAIQEENDRLFAENDKLKEKNKKSAKELSQVCNENIGLRERIAILKMQLTKNSPKTILKRSEQEEKVERLQQFEENNWILEDLNKKLEKENIELRKENESLNLQKKWLLESFGLKRESL